MTWGCRFHVVITVAVILRTPGKLIPLHVVLKVKQNPLQTVVDYDLLPKSSSLAQLPLIILLLGGEMCTAGTEVELKYLA